MKISIITVVLNNRPHIESCIKSVLNQTYQDIEYIIIDGGSTDGTLEVIRQYENRIAKWTSGRDGGIFHAMNKGIECASGEIIGFLHSDDCYSDASVIEAVVEAFVGKEVDAVYGDLLYVNKNNDRILRYWKSGRHTVGSLRRGWMPPHPSLFLKREVYEKFGNFDTSLRVSSDYDLVLRLFLKHAISTFYVPRVLVRMRIGGTSNRSFKNIKQKVLEDYRAAKKNGLKSGFLTIAFKNVTKLQQFVRRPSATEPSKEKV